MSFANEYTRQALISCINRTAVIFTQWPFERVVEQLSKVEERGLILDNIKFFSCHEPRKFSFMDETNRSLICFLTNQQTSSHEGVALILLGDDSVNILNNIFLHDGSTSHPSIFISQNQEATAQVEDMMFSSASREIPRETSKSCSNATLCVIKPHAVQKGNVGSILQLILNEGFGINKIGSFTLDIISATEFYEAYTGIIDHYNIVLNEFASGSCVAIEIVSRSGAQGSIVESFRNFCGPYDFSIAKELFPESLRARFGQSNVQNAVHCTDLVENATTEVDFFFDILMK